MGKEKSFTFFEQIIYFLNDLNRLRVFFHLRKNQINALSSRSMLRIFIIGTTIHQNGLFLFSVRIEFLDYRQKLLHLYMKE